jgi:esterase/lipase superfamily enzyme
LSLSFQPPPELLRCLLASCLRDASFGVKTAAIEGFASMSNLDYSPAQTDSRTVRLTLSRRQLLRASGAMLLLAGCDRPPDVIGIDNPEEPVLQSNLGWEHRVFIGTTRQATEAVGVFYGDKRSPELGLASVDVHVPPNHVKGELERPRHLPPNPETEFAIVAPTVYGTEHAFVAQINRELAKLPPNKRDILVFIHGYNTTASEALLRLGQFVQDTGYHGVPVLFTWASAGQLTKYVYDLNSALTARPQFGQMAALLAQTNARGFDVFAHSMGAFLTMEGVLNLDLQDKFNKRGRMKTLVLASPDIDIDLFESQLRQIKSDRSKIYVLVSADDSALRVSRILSGGVDRLGAAEAERVAALGVNVVDLSKIDDSSSGSHNKFAGSPEVVQLIGRGLNANPNALASSAQPLGALLEGIPIRILNN